MSTLDKVLIYENFVNDVLKADLKKILEERDRLCSKISDHLQLQISIEKLQDVELSNNELRTKIDLGCNFYVQAVVSDCTKIFVHIGFGFYLEYTFEEALRFLKKKIIQLNVELEEISKKSAQVKAHIKLVLQGLAELQKLNFEEDTPQREIL